MKWNSASRRGRESTISRHVLSALPVALIGVALAGSPHAIPSINSPTTPIGSNPLWLGTIGNFVFFIAQPPSSPTIALFKTDGTTGGTTQVAPMAGINVLVNNVGTVFISAGTKSYFLGNTTAAGQEVRVTDGTTAGTHQVADIYLGGIALSPTDLQVDFRTS